MSARGSGPLDLAPRRAGSAQLGREVALVRKVPFILGPLLILAGAWLLFFLWATATMVDPRLEGWPWWREVLGRLFTGGIGGIIIGVGLVVLGLLVAATGGRDSPRASGPKIRRDEV